MEEFISMVTSKLGIGETEGRKATGGVLQMLREQLDDSVFGQILDRIPGADSLLKETDESPAEESSGGGGLLGAASSMLGGLLGGGGGGKQGIAGITETLGKSGLSLTQIPNFLSMLVEFLKDKLGGDLFDTLKSQAGGLLGNDDK